MTTKQIICTLILVALASLALASSALASSALVSSAADVPVHSVPTTEAAGGVALAVGAVLTAMARRREFGSAEFLGATTEVWNAIQATLEVVPGYFESHCSGRSAAGDGSTVWRWGKPCPDATAVLDTILDTGWFEYPECPALLPGCRAYRAAIPGTIDLRKVADLADDTTVRWVTTDHGYQYPTIVGDAGNYVDYTTLIVGEEQGRQIVFTFHPGDPIRPAQVPADVDTTAVDTIAALKTAYPQIEWVKVAHTA